MGAGSTTGSVARPATKAKVGLLSTLAIVALIAVPASAFAAKGGGGGSAPTLAVAAVVSRSGGAGSLTVSGSHFTPSAGGQQVILWVAYPNDYCSADLTVCHGFYAYPWVNADGSFSVTYPDALMQAGRGSVSASQWSASRGKWVQVAKAGYAVP